VKVARTIADLAAVDRVDADHMAEALGYRALSVTGEVAQVG
jgi:predicted ATPase with chaperone activity